MKHIFFILYASIITIGRLLMHFCLNLATLIWYFRFNTNYNYETSVRKVYVNDFLPSPYSVSYKNMTVYDIRYKSYFHYMWNIQNDIKFIKPWKLK